LRVERVDISFPNTLKPDNQIRILKLNQQN
jgi:hypothetical protein